jgi:hypothetical protein
MKSEVEMRSSDALKLAGWIDAVSSWRTAALAAGVTVEEINTRTTDGMPLRFLWTDAATDDQGNITIPAGWRVIAP